MSGRIIPAISGKGQRFPGIGPPPTFGFLWLASELSWCLWVCHLANALQWAYTEAQGLLEVESSAILDLVGSNQFLSCPMAMSILLKGCALPPSLLFQYHTGYLTSFAHYCSGDSSVLLCCVLQLLNSIPLYECTTIYPFYCFCFK